jgi:CO dehydrogenase/acetyl-CoA synthase alpha subunit
MFLKRREMFMPARDKCLLVTYGVCTLYSKKMLPGFALKKLPKRRTAVQRYTLLTGGARLIHNLTSEKKYSKWM